MKKAGRNAQAGSVGSDHNSRLVPPPSPATMMKLESNLEMGDEVKSVKEALYVTSPSKRYGGGNLLDYMYDDNKGTGKAADTNNNDNIAKMKVGRPNSASAPSSLKLHQIKLLSMLNLSNFLADDTYNIVKPGSNIMELIGLSKGGSIRMNIAPSVFLRGHNFIVLFTNTEGFTDSRIFPLHEDGKEVNVKQKEQIVNLVLNVLLFDNLEYYTGALNDPLRTPMYSRTVAVMKRHQVLGSKSNNYIDLLNVFELISNIYKLLENRTQNIVLQRFIHGTSKKKIIGPSEFEQVGSSSNKDTNKNREADKSTGIDINKENEQAGVKDNNIGSSGNFINMNEDLNENTSSKEFNPSSSSAPSPDHPAKASPATDVIDMGSHGNKPMKNTTDTEKDKVEEKEKRHSPPSSASIVRVFWTSQGATDRISTSDGCISGYSIAQTENMNINSEIDYLKLFYYRYLSANLSKLPSMGISFNGSEISPKLDESVFLIHKNLIKEVELPPFHEFLVLIMEEVENRRSSDDSENAFNYCVFIIVRLIFLMAKRRYLIQLELGVDVLHEVVINPLSSSSYPSLLALDLRFKKMLLEDLNFQMVNYYLESDDDEDMNDFINACIECHFDDLFIEGVRFFDFSTSDKAYFSKAGSFINSFMGNSCIVSFKNNSGGPPTKASTSATAPDSSHSDAAARPVSSKLSYASHTSVLASTLDIAHCSQLNINKMLSDNCDFNASINSMVRQLQATLANNIYDMLISLHNNESLPTGPGSDYYLMKSKNLMKLRRSDLIFQFTDLTCDFVVRNTDDGSQSINKGYLLQVKGFKFSGKTISMLDDLKKRFHAKYVELSQLDAMEKDEIEAGRGHLFGVDVDKDLEFAVQCKMCGLRFKKDEQIYIQKFGLSQDNVYSSKYNYVSAFGYEISPKLTLKLAEIYRDHAPKLSNGDHNNINDDDNDDPNRPSPFLTKLARVMLARYSHILESRSERGDEKNPFYSYSPIKVCYYCQNLLVNSEFRHNCSEKLHLLLNGIDNSTSSNGGQSKSDKSFATFALMSGSFGEKKRVGASNSSDATTMKLLMKASSLHRFNLLKKDTRISSKMEDVFGGLSNRNTFWRADHLLRGSFQWRLFVMVHYIGLDGSNGDIDLNDQEDNGDSFERPLNPLANDSNGLGSVVYSIGQTTHTLLFENAEMNDINSRNPISRSNEDMMGILPVNQCRLHYLFATKKDLVDFLNSRSLEFHLYYSSYSELDKETKLDGNTSVNLSSSSSRNSSNRGSMRLLPMDYDGCATLPLKSLLDLNYDSTSETEKLDYNLPIRRCSRRKHLRVSIAITRDDLPASELVKLTTDSESRQPLVTNLSLDESKVHQKLDVTSTLSSAKSLFSEVQPLFPSSSSYGESISSGNNNKNSKNSSASVGVFTRDMNVFYPPAHYTYDRGIPEPWLAMLVSNKRASSYRGTSGAPTRFGKTSKSSAGSSSRNTGSNTKGGNKEEKSGALSFHTTIALDNFQNSSSQFNGTLLHHSSTDNSMTQSHTVLDRDDAILPIEIQEFWEEYKARKFAEYRSKFDRLETHGSESQSLQWLSEIDPSIRQSLSEVYSGDSKGSPSDNSSRRSVTRSRRRRRATGREKSLTEIAEKMHDKLSHTHIVGETKNNGDDYSIDTNNTGSGDDDDDDDDNNNGDGIEEEEDDAEHQIGTFGNTADILSSFNNASDPVRNASKVKTFQFINSVLYGDYDIDNDNIVFKNDKINNEDANDDDDANLRQINKNNNKIFSSEDQEFPSSLSSPKRLGDIGKKNRISGSSGHDITLTLAWEQFIQFSQLPKSISWSAFVQLFSECLDWAKMERERILQESSGERLSHPKKSHINRIAEKISINNSGLSQQPTNRSDNEIFINRYDIDRMIDTVESYLQAREGPNYTSFAMRGSAPEEKEVSHSRRFRRLLYALSIYYIASKSTASKLKSSLSVDLSSATAPPALSLHVLFSTLFELKSMFHNLIMQLKGGGYTIGKIPQSLEQDLTNRTSFVRFAVAYHLFYCSNLTRLFAMFALQDPNHPSSSSSGDVQTTNSNKSSSNNSYSDNNVVVSELNFLRFAEDCYQDIDVHYHISQTSDDPLSLRTHYIDTDPIVLQFIKSCNRSQVKSKGASRLSSISYKMNEATRRNSCLITPISPNSSTAAATATSSDKGGGHSGNDADAQHSFLPLSTSSPPSSPDSPFAKLGKVSTIARMHSQLKLLREAKKKAPKLQLWCEVHGLETFTISDICCSKCESDSRRNENLV